MPYAYQTSIGTGPFLPRVAPEFSIFPRHSARVFKETLAVVCLVLAGAAFAMLALLLAPELLGARAPSAACSTLGPAGLLSSWCSALI